MHRSSSLYLVNTKPVFLERNGINIIRYRIYYHQDETTEIHIEFVRITIYFTIKFGRLKERLEIKHSNIKIDDHSVSLKEICTQGEDLNSDEGWGLN